MTRIMLVCGFTLLLQTAVAQVPANPYALAIDGRDGSLLLAHRDTLLLRSTDGGVVWTRLTLPVTEFPKALVTKVHVLPDAPGHLLAFTRLVSQQCRLLQSRDAGATWTVHPMPEDEVDLEHIRDVPGAPGVVYVTAGGLHAFDANRGSWQTFSSLPIDRGFPPEDATQFDVSQDGRQFWVGSSFFTPGILRGRLYHSADSGATWTRVHDTLPRTPTFVRVDPADPAHVFFASIVLRESHDAGASWIPAYPDTTWPVVHAAWSWNSSIRWLAPVRDSLRISTDAGASWRATGPPVSSFINGLVQDPADPCRVFLLRVDGLWQSTNCGMDWQLNPLRTTPVSAASAPSPGAFTIQGPYPHPARTSRSDVVRFDLVSPTATTADIRVIDLLGRTLTAQTVAIPAGARTWELPPLRALPAGLLHVQIRCADRIHTRPLLILP